MLANKFFKLILVSVLFLFAITTTGIYTWAPVIAKNLDHHHDVTISVETDSSSQWSLIHHAEEQVLIEDTKNHNWTSYDEAPFHHSTPPVQAKDQMSIDPVFLLSFSLPLILLFLSLFERPVRSYALRKRIEYLCNSYIFTKGLIVLRN
ncbi:hypothetical protein ABTK66_09450 [Acinetobacter baumannii]